MVRQEENKTDRIAPPRRETRPLAKEAAAGITIPRRRGGNRRGKVKTLSKTLQPPPFDPVIQVPGLSRAMAPPQPLRRRRKTRGEGTGSTAAHPVPTFRHDH